MNYTSKFIYQLVMTIGIILYGFMLGLMIFGEHMLPDERTFTDFTLIDYSKGWQRQTPEGDYEPIAVPGHYELTSENQLVI